MLQAINKNMGSIKSIFLLIAFSVVFISGCNASETDQPVNSPYIAELKVFKSPTCGCCSKWIDHMNVSGFLAIPENSQSLSMIKDTHGIPKNHRSCHTGVTEDGYVFEGHIPAKYIKQFMNQKPEGQVGLVVPGMPVGSPGMEYQDKFNPYTIMSFNKEGDLQPYVEVLTFDQQFESLAKE